MRTHLPSSGAAGTSALSRAHINVLSADVIVALPGGALASPPVARLVHPQQILDFARAVAAGQPVDALVPTLVAVTSLPLAAAAQPMASLPEAVPAGM